jgi:hypothetical protein
LYSHFFVLHSPSNPPPLPPLPPLLSTLSFFFKHLPPS